MSTPKKKPDTQAAASWITQGRAELHQQSPAQRGIQHPNSSQQEKVERPKRERFTVNLDPSLIEWARRAVVHTLGLTLSGLMEEALTRELVRREKKNGEAFPTSAMTPKKGRPVKLKG
jgi:hypothetical protein